MRWVIIDRPNIVKICISHVCMALHEFLWDFTTRVIYSPTVLSIMSNRGMILGRTGKELATSSLLRLPDFKAAFCRLNRSALISIGLPLECTLCTDICRMFDGAFVVVDQFGVLRGNCTLILKESARCRSITCAPTPHALCTNSLLA